MKRSGRRPRPGRTAFDLGLAGGRGDGGGAGTHQGEVRPGRDGPHKEEADDAVDQYQGPTAAGRHERTWSWRSGEPRIQQLGRMGAGVGGGVGRGDQKAGGGGGKNGKGIGGGDVEEPRREWPYPVSPRLQGLHPRGTQRKEP